MDETPPLTPRELEVAGLLPFYTFEEIGHRLGISPRTVKAHTDRIRHKLGAVNAKDAARILHERGVI